MRGKTIVVLTALVVVSVTMALWFTGRAVTPKTPSWDDVVEESRLGGYRLITTPELREAWEKNRTSILLVDTRQEWEYRTGHIMGAVNFPMEPTAWSRWSKKGDLEKLLAADKERMIVFY